MSPVQVQGLTLPTLMSPTTHQSRCAGGRDGRSAEGQNMGGEGGKWGREEDGWIRSKNGQVHWQQPPLPNPNLLLKT